MDTWLWWVFFFIIAAAFAAFIGFILWKGIYRRVVLGMRIIAIMVAIEMAAIFLMLLGMMLFFIIGPSFYIPAIIMLQIGLLGAVPASLYLILFVVELLMSRNKIVYSDAEIAEVDDSWFIRQKQEAHERDEKAKLLLEQMEEQLLEKEKEIKATKKQIAKVKDEEQLSQLSLEVKNIEQSHDDLKSEQQGLHLERDLLAKEQKRLDDDHKRYGNLLKEIEEAQAIEDEIKVADAEIELRLLREDNLRKQAELDAELELEKEKDKEEKAIEVAKVEATDKEIDTLKELAEKSQQGYSYDDWMRYYAENPEAAAYYYSYYYPDTTKSEETDDEVLELGQEQLALPAPKDGVEYTEMNDVKKEAKKAPVKHEKKKYDAQVVDQVSQRANAELLAKQMALLAEQENSAELQKMLDDMKNKISNLEGEKAAKKQRDKERRVAKMAKMRATFSRDNVEKHVRKYFIELAACFLMDRDAYKDKFGLSPYNRITITKSTGGKEKVTHSILATKDKLYKFAELLIDVDRFLAHQHLFPLFVELVGEGTSLVRISEKLHLLYLQNYRKDFAKDYRYKEDFENILVLASHHYIVKTMTFKTVFTPMPTYPYKTELFGEEGITYLADGERQSRFESYFPNYRDLGFEGTMQAYVASYGQLLRSSLDVSVLVSIILKDANRTAKTLERLNKKRPKKATVQEAVKAPTPKDTIDSVNKEMEDPTQKDQDEVGAKVIRFAEDASEPKPKRTKSKPVSDEETPTKKGG